MFYSGRMAGWLIYVGAAVALSQLMYFGLGGALYLRYYRARRPSAGVWKCQPGRWLSPALNRHAIILGAANVALGGMISGTLAYHAWNGGFSTLYFHLEDRSLAYTLLSSVLVFVVTDALAYYAHRTYHRPLLFRWFHRWHHRYNTPTPFTVTAMHPVEFLTYQLIFAAPMFTLPLYVGSYYGLLVYIFYFTTWDHSGIRHRSLLPWQPPSLFHDDHHKYFHCNFGQNAMIWDRLHGTLRRRGRRYGAEVFGGRGAPTGESGPGELVDYR